jgi:hypothetical protein
MTARRRWRAILAGAGLAFGCALGAAAETENLDALLAGNTLTVTNRLGTLSIHLAADHSFNYADSNAAQHEGVWRTTAQELCLRAAPAEPPQENCLMVPVHRLGERWTAEDSVNGHIVYDLARRRH